MEKLNEILQIPERCLLDRKIHKTFFKKNFELTISERKLLDDFSIVVGIDWMASVSPASANITKFEAGQFIYEEVQVISVQTNKDGFDRNVPKIADVVQKYIPYPIILFIYNDDVFVMNTCDKRINQNDSTLRTIEQRYFTEPITLSGADDKQRAFLNSLIYSQLDKTNLKTYYDSYSQAIVALQTAAFSGTFTQRNKERSDADVKILQRMQTLQNEIATLQNLAKKETQLNQQVNINTQVQDKRKEIQHLQILITT